MEFLSLGLLYRCGHDKHSHLRPSKNPSSGREPHRTLRHDRDTQGALEGVVLPSSPEVTMTSPHSDLIAFAHLSPTHLVSMIHWGPAWTVHLPSC